MRDAAQSACSPCLAPALSVVQVLAPVVVLCDPPARLRSPRSRGAVRLGVAGAGVGRPCSFGRDQSLWFNGRGRTTLLKINL